MKSRSSLALALLGLLFVTACGRSRAQLAATPPAVPTGLVATTSGQLVDLDWNDNLDIDLVGYRVYRGTQASGPFTLLTPTLVTTSDYQDTTVLPNQTYYFAVQAEDYWQNLSARSAVVSVTVSGEHTNPDGTVWFSEANHDGAAAEVFIEELFWGRLVDVQDAQGQLRHRDFLVGEDIQSDGLDFQLDVNPITDETTLTILHDAGTPGYQAAFQRLDQNLGAIATKAPEGDLPPFSLVPRNATIGVRFSDLLDPSSLAATTLQVRVGTPPAVPFEVRLLVDSNFGGEVGGQFFSTRALVDTTISELEASAALLPVNNVGLPASMTTALANVALRFPSQVNFSVGQFQILANLAGNGLATTGNGPVDFASTTVDVLRGMRSGGDTQVTGDAYNGFLMDLVAPRLIGSQPVNLTVVAPDALGGQHDYLVSFQYSSLLCAQPVAVGDVLRLSTVFAVVTQATSAPTLGFLFDVKVELVSGDPAAFLPGAAQLLAPFDKFGGDLSDCFVSFVPGPAAPPTTFVSPSAQVRLRFSEPMDGGTASPFDSFTITRTATSPGLTDFVVGTIVGGVDQKSFQFVPSLPLAHTTGSIEPYFIDVLGGPLGLLDLAGNSLAESLDQVQFELSPVAPTERNGGIVLHFTDPNEDGDVSAGVPLTEYAGQFLQDSALGLIRSRPISRFTASADTSQAVPAAMIPISVGLQTPLSPLGSRMMAVYRYFDLGFAIGDTSSYNVDVEGLSWAPFGGQVLADFFPEFELNLAHASKLPDEHKGLSLLPTKPISGLNSSAFLDNLLPDPVHGQVTVHPKAAGYVIDPTDLFVGASGTKLLPYPMNTGLPESQWTFYTWRDTSIAARGGALGNGIPTKIEEDLGLISGDPLVFGQNDGDYALAGNVPSIGLPLLLEFMCYPSASSIGLNTLAVAIAINSSPKPTFRIFSSGGYDTAGQPIIKNPDLELVPTGGFNAIPGSAPLGSPTPPADNVFHYGQLDLVVRVSRTYTRWFDSGQANPDYFPPVLEPSSMELPAGTQLQVHFRGATSINAIADPTTDPTLNADALNAYGDQVPKFGVQPYGTLAQQNFGVHFLVDDSWSTDVQSIDTAQLFQARFTFIGNTVTGGTPDLSSFGLAFLSN